MRILSSITILAAAILVAVSTSEAYGRAKRAAGEFTVDNAEAEAKQLFEQIHQGVAAVKAAQEAHNARAGLKAGAEAVEMNLKMTKLYMFVKRHKRQLRSLFKEMTEEFKKMLHKAYNAMERGIKRFPKDDPLVAMASDLINTQMKLLKRYIKALEGSFFDKMAFFSFYNSNFKNNDKRLLELIEKRVQANGRHIASLVPFMAMAQSERVAIGLFLGRGQAKLEKMVADTAEKLRSLARQVPDENAQKRRKRSADELSVATAAAHAKELLREVNAGVKAITVAEKKHDSRAGLKAGADMLLTNLKATKLFMFARRHRKELNGLYEKMKAKTESLLEKAQKAMKEGIEHFPKDDPLVAMASDLIVTQMKLLDHYIKALKGPFRAKVRFFSFFKLNFKDNDKHLLELIEKRVKANGRHVASLVPFLAMAQSERVAIGLFTNKGVKELEKLVHDTADKLRSLAKQVPAH